MIIKTEKPLTEEQLSNLKKLRDYMASLPEDYKHFDMVDFAVGDGCHLDPGQLLENNYCGTVCCLAGHGPAAGIEPNTLHAKIDWDDYCKESFGCTLLDELGNYLFGAFWKNNIGYAIERLDTVIQHKGNVPREIAVHHSSYMK